MDKAEIRKRIAEIKSTSVEWWGHMPRDAEKYDAAAGEKSWQINADDVLQELSRIVMPGATDAEKIDAAISLACEPADLTEGACVNVDFGDER